MSYIKNILDHYHVTYYLKQITCDVYYNKTHYYHAFDHVVTKNLTATVELCPLPQLLPNLDEPSDHYPLLFNINY